MTSDETRATDVVPDEPGVEDTHAEHLPTGDFVPPVADVPPAEAQGDASGELPKPEDDGGLGALSRLDSD
jgi:hypothetical protein